MEVEYETRDDAVLTIYDDGSEIDRVVISDIRSTEDMYNFFVERGFERVEPELAEALLVVRRAEKRAEEEKDRVQRDAFLERRKKDHEMRIARGEAI